MMSNYEYQLAEEFGRRHPATQEKLHWLVPNPNLPEGKAAEVARRFFELAVELARLLADGAQLTIALQRLIDAKDAAVRQAIADGEA